MFRRQRSLSFIDNERDTGRVEAFSDGVIAIAITLLVLDIHVPEATTHSGHLLEELLKLWPSYLSYITSFAVIGIIWLNHHRMYSYIRHTDHISLALNTLALMFVSFIPFPTAVLASYIQQLDDNHAAAVLYSGTLLVTTLLFNILWWYAAHGRRLMDKDLDANVIRAISRAYVLGIPLYLLSFVLAFIWVPGCLLIYLLTSVVYFFSAGSIPVNGSSRRTVGFTKDDSPN
jgi:uncharacterized membrane protein